MANLPLGPGVGGDADIRHRVGLISHADLLSFWLPLNDELVVIGAQSDPEQVSSRRLLLRSELAAHARFRLHSLEVGELFLSAGKSLSQIEQFLVQLRLSRVALLCAILSPFLPRDGLGVLVDCKLEHVDIEEVEDGALFAVRVHAVGLGRSGRGDIVLLLVELQVRKNSLLIISRVFDYIFFCL